MSDRVPVDNRAGVHAPPPMSAAGTPIWETGGWSPLPALAGAHHAAVCVIGLGGSGLACLAELSSSGASAVGIDAGAVAGCAAGRNGGLFRAGLPAFHHEAAARHGRERAARLYRLTMAERERILSETPDLVRRTGWLRLVHDGDEEADCRAHHDALRADDLPVRWYEGPLGRGVFVAGDAAGNPLARCRAVARRLVAAGVRLFENSPAVRIAGGTVDTPDGTVRCRAVVVAVDGALTRVLPELADRARPARLQMLGTALPDEGADAGPAMSTRWGWDYWQRTPDGDLALGGCRDAGGDAEWTWDDTPSAVVQQSLDRRLQTVVRHPGPVTHRWAATVSCTAGGLPIIAEARPRVWAVGAYNGTGNLVGALCGRLAAQLALGRLHETPFD